MSPSLPNESRGFEPPKNLLNLLRLRLYTHPNFNWDDKRIENDPKVQYWIKNIKDKDIQ